VIRSLHGAEAGKTTEWSGEGEKVAAEGVGVAVAEESFHLPAGALPDGNGTGEEGFALGGEVQAAAAAVGGVGGDLEKSATLEGLESGGKGGAIHAEEVRDGRHAGRVGAIEGDEQGKLTIGELDGTKCVVEAAG
jgi:hypothetical protein